MRTFGIVVATLSKIGIIGLLDALEFKYFNPMVFYEHNFRDIVPYMKPGVWAAFVSGVKCAWFLFLPLSLIYYVLDIPPWIVNLISFGEAAACIGVMVKSKIDGYIEDIYANHTFFYSAFAFGEAVVFTWKVMTLIFG